MSIANSLSVIDDVNGRHSWNIPLSSITEKAMQVNLYHLSQNVILEKSPFHVYRWTLEIHFG